MKKEIVLPPWMPLEAWTRWTEMRQEMKKFKVPFTEGAMKLAISKLAELKTQGQSPAAVLDQSVLRGWRGLFPVSNGSKPAVAEPEPPADAMDSLTWRSGAIGSQAARQKAK